MIAAVTGKVTEVAEPSGYGSGGVVYRDVDDGKLQKALESIPLGSAVRILIKVVDEPEAA